MSEQEIDQMPESPEFEEMKISDFISATESKQVMTSDEELKKLHHELEDYKNKYLRLLADQENTRKRQQKEKIEQMRFANEGLIIDFLKPMDNLENALNFAKNMSDEVKNWAIGFQMILTQFKDVLNLNGVTPFESQGQQFDPYVHEAVEMVESDEYPPGSVVAEFSRGYKMGDRIIRPARVKVSRTAEEKVVETIDEEIEN